MSARASEGQCVEYANCEILAELKIELSVTANLGQVFLFQVPYLIAIFLFTFAILEKFVADLLRNIANLLSQLKTPHFLLEVPHFLLGKCVLFPVPKLTFILLYFHIKDYFCT